MFLSPFKLFTKHYLCVVKCIFVYSRLKWLTWLLQYLLCIGMELFSISILTCFNSASTLGQHLDVSCSETLLGQVLMLPEMFEGTWLMALLCSYFLLYGQSKALVHSCILLVKDLFLWIEFKIVEDFPWNKASVLIKKIETFFIGMTATQLTPCRASAVDRGEQIINEKPHKVSKGMSYWLYFFMQFSSFCMLGPLRKWTRRGDIVVPSAVGTVKWLQVHQDRV